jgi:hypothetical protein
MVMSRRDLNKETMYEGVKTILESGHRHIHLSQPKLYTLFSIAFNHLLYLSTKDPGHYIIRVEDSYLLEKLQYKAKDDTSRKFIRQLALPRRFKYGPSCFHLDFFNVSTWANTNELPKEKIKGALIVKNASKKPVNFIAEEEEDVATLSQLPEDYYVSFLADFVPNITLIAFDEIYENLASVNFPFIKEEEKDKVAKGVVIASNVSLEDLDN